MKIANIPSPYGSETNNPRLLVIHSMGEIIDTDGEDYPAHVYLNKLGLSAHYLVTPSGIIIKTRDEHKGAYHAKGFNTDSIGIELLLPGLHNYYSFLEDIKEKYVTNSQYSSLVELCREIVKKYPGIDIKRHSDLSPGRKFDPGSGFPWGQFLSDVS